MQFCHYCDRLVSRCIVSMREHVVSSSFRIIFSQFLSSNGPITPYKYNIISYWWFFLSQGNRWIKYRVHPIIRRPKPYQLTFAFLVTLYDFQPLLSNQLTGDLILEFSDRSMFYPVPHTAWKASNSALNRRRVVVLEFRSTWANAVPISNRAFSCLNVHAKW